MAGRIDATGVFEPGFTRNPPGFYRAGLVGTGGIVILANKSINRMGSIEAILPEVDKRHLQFASIVNDIFVYCPIPFA
ncbi:hypothetical protein SD10_16865 [Spirosoma radiotolerans]|uniref:Uncharacterized protein n=1 Tax=Spirosoma radiotolerans TaxID=1379870 RepID=A0A0E3ZXB3_9BACT|nr:hypothetical protein SD10_16865 [Spirosoma radiotolerans]